VSTSFTNVIAPFHWEAGVQIVAINIVFTFLPPSQKILKTYAFEEEIDGIPVLPLTDRFPNLGTLRMTDIGDGVQPETYKLDYVKNWIRPTNSQTYGFELWIRPGAICNVYAY
jgi:hypothetical protein